MERALALRSQGCSPNPTPPPPPPCHLPWLLQGTLSAGDRGWKQSSPSRLEQPGARHQHPSFPPHKIRLLCLKHVPTPNHFLPNCSHSGWIPGECSHLPTGLPAHDVPRPRPLWSLWSHIPAIPRLNPNFLARLETAASWPPPSPLSCTPARWPLCPSVVTACRCPLRGCSFLTNCLLSFCISPTASLSVSCLSPAPGKGLGSEIWWKDPWIEVRGSVNVVGKKFHVIIFPDLPSPPSSSSHCAREQQTTVGQSSQSRGSVTRRKGRPFHSTAPLQQASRLHLRSTLPNAAVLLDSLPTLSVPS